MEQISDDENGNGNLYSYSVLDLKKNKITETFLSYNDRAEIEELNDGGVKVVLEEKDGNKKTYSFDESGYLKKIDNNESVCSKEYKPVCGWNNLTGHKTYSNKCEFEKAGAKFLYEGKCGVVKESPCHRQLPVCGMPQKPNCPIGAMCKIKAPVPTNYQNRCLLEKAGADFLYEGECKVNSIKDVIDEIQNLSVGVGSGIIEFDIAPSSGVLMSDIDLSNYYVYADGKKFTYLILKNIGVKGLTGFYTVRVYGGGQYPGDLHSLYLENKKTGVKTNTIYINNQE
jgi:hypothetical protein